MANCKNCNNSIYNRKEVETQYCDTCRRTNNKCTKCRKHYSLKTDQEKDTGVCDACRK